MTRSIYLDHNATTPLDPRALEAMMPFLTSEFGNASSATHEWGLRAREAVESARRSVAALIGARPEEVYFTSGATEANNLALKGAARAAADRGKGWHLITTSIEHASVTQSIKDLAREGFEVSFVPPGSNGIVDPEKIHDALRDDTVIVSCLAANGEIGTIQPTDIIGPMCRQRGILFHTDATQAVGKIPFDVESHQVDLLSMSSHKIYGPKGVGALFMRRGVEIDPIITGGGQERGVRSGTLNVPGIVGLGTAAEICRENLDAHSEHLTRLSRMLLEKIRKCAPDTVLNGHEEMRIPGTLNLAFPRVPSERMMLALKDFALSTSSACHSGSAEPSPILAAIGLDPSLADCSIRIGMGRGTTEEQIESLGQGIGKALRRLRGPLDRVSSSPHGV